jgi:acyl-CoA thioesterase I
MNDMLQNYFSVPHRRALLLGLTGCALAPKAALAQSRPYSIVALGDSLTAGFGLTRSQAFPARLNARLKAAGYQVSIANAGLSGDTTAGALARFDFAVPKGTSGLLLAIGANDMLQGMSPAAAQRNIDAIIMRAKARGMAVALLGMRAPTNWGGAYRTAFDGIYPTLARKHTLLLDPFVLEGIALNPALNQADGIHPTAVGADRIAARLVPFTARAFGLRALPISAKVN